MAIASSVISQWHGFYTDTGMGPIWKNKLYRRLTYAFLALSCLIVLLMIFIDRLVKPILEDRLHTLIIQGSDSLYVYKLGSLKVNFFGGDVEVENLMLEVDSTRYNYLRTRNELPSLTMQLKLGKGYIRGLSVISLLVNRKISVNEIMSKDADIKLSRHIRKFRNEGTKQPIWKAIRPKIEDIYIGRIRLEGIKLLYKNVDTSESVKIKFDRCDAVFKDIRVDSSSASDTTRIGFTRSIELKFNDIKFRTEDSSYKMKAKGVVYSSEKKSLEVDSFKLQPTREKEDIYKAALYQKELYYVSFSKVKFTGIRLDHFIYNNVIEADSVLFNKPDLAIYSDKTLAPDFASKVGKYPQQQLLKASSAVMIKFIKVTDAQVLYTEKDQVTKEEGKIDFDHITLNASNVTNEPQKIKENPVMSAEFGGNILGTGALKSQFKFYLNATDGQYEASGSVVNVGAKQLNGIAVPLANVQLNNFNLNLLSFQVKGADMEARGNVRMLYKDLDVSFRKTDRETGKASTKKFLTKVLKKYVLWPENPVSGTERVSKTVVVSRLTTEAFFGFLWKTIFAGMQNIMMRSGG